MSLIKSQGHEGNIDCYKVIRKWETNYPEPLKLAKGEAVIIGKKEIKNKKWAGWIWCESEKNSGWVPQQIVQKIDDREGIITENYSAKELNVVIGEKVKGLREFNGWIWVKRGLNNEEGWLPREILQKITDNEMSIDKMKIEDRKDFEPPAAVAKWGWKYHHLGIPTSERKENEKFIPHLKFYVAGFNESPYGIEWMRFEPDSPVHQLIQKVPHIAFEVENIDLELSKRKINLLEEPYSPSEGVNVAMIEHNGAPIELIEFKKGKAGDKEYRPKS